MKGVTFDLWQTLLIDSRELGRARMQVRLDGARRILHKVGEEFSEDQVRDAYRRCFRTCHDIREQEKDVAFKEQVDFFISYIDDGLMDRLAGEDIRRIAEIYADSFFEYPPVLHQDAIRVLSDIQDSGNKLGLISNTGMTPGVIFRTFMDQVGILRYFDVLTFSDEVRLAKPSGEIFRIAANELGTETADIVHVGDHLVNDVLGAQKAGMKTIWIETYEENRKSIESSPDLTVSDLGQVPDALSDLRAGLTST